MVLGKPTDELEERLQQMTLPHPSLPFEKDFSSHEFLYYYPSFIEYLQSSVRSHQYEPFLV